MEKQYSPNPAPVGRDSIRVRSTPRAANCSSSSSSAPERFSRRYATTLVRSEPVASGTAPGSRTATKRVVVGRSPMSSARAARPYRSAAAGAQIAAS